MVTELIQPYLAEALPPDFIEISGCRLRQGDRIVFVHYGRRYRGDLFWFSRREIGIRVEDNTRMYFPLDEIRFVWAYPRRP